MCWEDPLVDAAALRIHPEDVVVTITSAGCNPLNLLLQGPRRLVCVDLNPAQNALFELKLAALASLDWQTFANIFGDRRRHLEANLYKRYLRPRLSAPAVHYWDAHFELVAGDLYVRGRLGNFFRVVRAYLSMCGLSQERLAPFFELGTLHEQREWYSRNVAPHFVRGPLSKRLARNRALLYLSGIHPQQLARLSSEADPYERAAHCIEHALTKLPIKGNYFWHLAATGRFRHAEVPPYLLEQNFHVLRERIGCVEVVYGTLQDMLGREQPRSVNKFNLRDILDWMQAHEERRTWTAIVRAARHESRVVFRSISTRARLPAYARCFFQEQTQLSGRLTAADRSATHGSVVVASSKLQRHAV